MSYQVLFDILCIHMCRHEFLSIRFNPVYKFSAEITDLIFIVDADLCSLISLQRKNIRFSN